MKIKVKKIKKVVTSSQKTNIVNMDKVNHFIYCCRNLQYAPAKLREYLVQNFALVFPKRKYPREETLGAVYLAIAYEIQKKCYDESRTEMPAAVAKNYEAAVNFNLQKSESGIGSIFEYKHNTEKIGEQTMKTKTVVVKKKVVAPTKQTKVPKVKGEKRVTLAGRLVEIFESIAGGKRITDQQIADQINKEFNKSHDLKNVSASRAAYNRGALSGQASKPKVPVEAYEPKASKK